ncbi:MAG: S-adenosylmethionine decarboxylase [Candidatus Paceibacterota bacterium]
MENNFCNFGEHFMLDGYNGNFKKLNDKNLVLDCLNELPSLIQMSKLAEPEVYFAPDNIGTKDSGGWSGFVVINESHISIHTFPYKGFISIDVYTCRNGMNVNFISKYFIEKFELKETEINFVKRGTKFPIKNIY